MIYKRDYQEETQHQLRQGSPITESWQASNGSWCVGGCWEPCPFNPSVIPLCISLDECLSPSPPPHHHYLHSNPPLNLLPSHSTSHPTQLSKLAFDPVHSSLFPQARCVSCNPGWMLMSSENLWRDTIWWWCFSHSSFARAKIGM